MKTVNAKLLAALMLAAVLGSVAVARAPSGGYCDCAARCVERPATESAACESRCARRFTPVICEDGPPGGRLCIDDAEAKAQASAAVSPARSPAS